MKPVAARIAAFVLVVGLAAACESSSSNPATTTAAPASTTAAPATTVAPATTAAPSATGPAPFHTFTADTVSVTGTGTCEFGEGVAADGGEGYLITCALDMSDPRVGGTETQDRFRVVEGGDAGNVWVSEEDVITNEGGAWRGTAQIVHDATAPAGEAHFVGEGAYAGLEFHYYFSGYCGDPNQIELRGWISPENTATDSPAAEAAPFHAIPSSLVVVSGRGSCNLSPTAGTSPEGGTGWLATCALDMSDPRVGGTETQDRMSEVFEGEIASIWLVEDDVIANAGGTWRGSAQFADDGIPSGEAHFVGEGAYEGLEFHYYFNGSCGSWSNAEFRGWISEEG